MVGFQKGWLIAFLITMTRKSFLTSIVLTLSAILWGYVFVRYETLRLFTCFVPLAFVFNVAKNKRLRNTSITIFVILWTLIFHYESIRHFYLSPIFQRPLYKMKFLFPPAGWIMFYNVDDVYGHVEVYGIKGKTTQPIDPHHIFRTRTIGFDNFHRGILGTVLSRHHEQSFCRYLQYRFPYFDRFVVSVAYYPSITREPYKRIEEVRYQCGVRE